MKWLIPSKSIIIVSGQEKKAMKTMFALLVAIIVATGKAVGEFLKPGDLAPCNVLYVLDEGEDAETRERMAAIAKGVGAEPSDERFRFMFHHRVKLDDLAWRRKLMKEVKEFDIKLVIFDTMSYMMEGDENNATEMGDVIDTIQEIRKLGPAVLCLFHLKKSLEPGGDPDSEIRGSGRFPQARDQHIALRRYHRKQAIIEMTLLQRGGGDREFGVLWHLTEKELIDEDGDPFKVLTKAYPTVFELSGEKFARKYAGELEEDEEYSAKDLAELWGVAPSQAKVMAKALKEQGYLGSSRGTFYLLSDDEDE